MMTEMLLSELRKSAGVTQEGLASSLGIKQPTLSRMESQSDMQISTLRRVIESLGGKLEIIAHLPDGDVRLSQFQDAGLRGN
jgi:predicted transcriptional regulator